MNKTDRDRRRAFLEVFQPMFFWPSDTMAVKCWRSVREAFNDQELDLLLRAMIATHNSRVHRLKNGGPDKRRDRLQGLLDQAGRE